VALLPAPIEPVARIAMTRRDGGAMIMAVLLNRGVKVSKVVRHKDGTFTAAIFDWRNWNRVNEIAQELATRLRALGFTIIQSGVDFYTGLMFGGTKTPMVRFSLTDVPVTILEPWAVKARGQGVGLLRSKIA
jgi:hypothetical protein